MSATMDKIKGTANKAAGAVKQGIGKATGNRTLQAEGAAQEIKGCAQSTIGGAKQSVTKATRAIKSGL